SNNFHNAGWRAYDTGWAYQLRSQAVEVLACADRCEAHWEKANAGAREKAIAIRLRGIGYQLVKNYPGAIVAFQEALKLWRAVVPGSEDVAIGLNGLAEAERLSGDYAAAERDYLEALRIAKKINDREGVAVYTGDLAELALDREKWAEAEVRARDALVLAEAVGRQ